MFKSEKLRAIFIKGLANYFANRGTCVFCEIHLCTDVFSCWPLKHESLASAAKCSDGIMLMTRHIMQNDLPYIWDNNKLLQATYEWYAVFQKLHLENILIQRRRF